MNITRLPNSELVIDDGGYSYLLAPSGQCEYEGCRRRRLEGANFCHLHAGHDQERYGLALCGSCRSPVYKSGLCREHWLLEQKQ